MVHLRSMLSIFAIAYSSLMGIAQADTTIADPETGCKVWNSSALNHYSISWQGPCNNGFADGMGSLQWFAGGRPSGRYDGEYQAGKMQGLGTYAMPNGSRHTGHYHHNKRNSQGTYVWEDGTRYEGQFSENMMQGEGQTIWADGSLHIGEYKHDKKNGFGVMRLAKGNANIQAYLEKGHWEGDFFVLKGLFVEDNFVFLCAEKHSCIQTISANNMVLNEEQNTEELKEIFKEIANSGE